MKHHLYLRTPQPATGVSRALRARSVPGVPRDTFLTLWRRSRDTFWTLPPERLLQQAGGFATGETPSLHCSCSLSSGCSYPHLVTCSYRKGAERHRHLKHDFEQKVLDRASQSVPKGHITPDMFSMHVERGSLHVNKRFTSRACRKMFVDECAA